MFDASTVYGAPPIAGGPNGVARPRMVGGGSAPTQPSASAVSTATADRLRSGLVSDPTFWLVAMIGVASGLAIWSV